MKKLSILLPLIINIFAGHNIEINLSQQINSELSTVLDNMPKELIDIITSYTQNIEIIKIPLYQGEEFLGYNFFCNGYCENYNNCFYIIENIYSIFASAKIDEILKKEIVPKLKQFKRFIIIILEDCFNCKANHEICLLNIFCCSPVCGCNAKRLKNFKEMKLQILEQMLEFFRQI